MDDDELGLLPSASGILQCLKVLAQEAATLHLFGTLSAIEDALEAAARESGMDSLDDRVTRRAGRPVLH